MNLKFTIRKPVLLAINCTVVSLILLSQHAAEAARAPGGDSLQDVVNSSDRIIVGTLGETITLVNNPKSPLKKYFEGTLTVKKTLKREPLDKSLKVVVDRAKDDRQGQPGIWFLKQKGELWILWGFPVDVGCQWAFRPLSDLDAVKKYLEDPRQKKDAIKKINSR